MDKYIGKKLDGRYEIRELIGVGGMANVYKAYDVVEARTVAVKILREEYMNNDEFMRRFRNESRAISLLDHPNIVKVYDVIFSNRIQSIVMEYIDGITLKDYIEQEHVLRWKEALHFAVQISKALANNPGLLLLDEVTTGLDLSVQAKVLDLIRKIRSRYNISIILVSHDLAVIRMLADRTMVMLDGQVVESGLTDQILEDPQHAYTQQLVHSLL